MMLLLIDKSHRDLSINKKGDAADSAPCLRERDFWGGKAALKMI